MFASFYNFSLFKLNFHLYSGQSAKNTIKNQENVYLFLSFSLFSFVVLEEGFALVDLLVFD